MNFKKFVSDHVAASQAAADAAHERQDDQDLAASEGGNEIAVSQQRQVAISRPSGSQPVRRQRRPVGTGVAARVFNRKLDKIHEHLDRTEDTGEVIRASARDAKGRANQLMGGVVDTASQLTTALRHLRKAEADLLQIAEAIGQASEDGDMDLVEQLREPYEAGQRESARLGAEVAVLNETLQMVRQEHIEAAEIAKSAGNGSSTALVIDSARRLVIESREAALGLSPAQAAKKDQVQRAIEGMATRADRAHALLALTGGQRSFEDIQATVVRRQSTADWLENVAIPSRTSRLALEAGQVAAQPAQSAAPNEATAPKPDQPAPASEPAAPGQELGA